MKNSIALRVFLFSIAAVCVGILVQALLFSPSPDDYKNKFPWDIQIDDAGNSSVFGLTLGKSTMGDGLRQFMADTEVSLFIAPDDSYAIEAFFKDINLAGLGAKIILTADVPLDTLQAMYERGARISTLGSGTRRITLNFDDLEIARSAPIRSITYLPKVNLDPEVILRRFGEPDSRLKEEENNIEHWLYPSKGLGIAVSENKKEVIQYISPAQFNELSQPLIGLEHN